ncbi:hypothetical protein Glove_120g214 [Diversispora epigaea]|uniref:Uncharacterized protein n=1 Tax=Diversispora epigaea TaxID=1348612 RepID=A0A397J9R9_9GLOM|nr:hypothetical protein Glove_120g214 [Diversispora epigaea]
MADAQSELDLLKRVIKLQTENDDMITQARKEQALEQEVQGSQHRFHNTSWYKDIKKLEDIVWYDEKPEIVIPQRIQKIKEFINQVSKGVDMWQINVEINKAYYSICDTTTSTDQKHFVE